MAENILIVGASHAGVQTAFSLRQGGWDGDITLLSDEAELPYHRPPLSKNFLSENKSSDDIRLRAENAYEKANIELKFSTRVVELDPVNRVITIEGGEQKSYSKLVLATGARPRQIEVPGSEAAGVYYLRSLRDANSILAHLGEARRVVIIGGGYIGLEAAASFRAMGKDVILLEAASRILARVAAPEISQFYKRIHQEEGVMISEGCTVETIHTIDGGLEVASDRGDKYHADIVLVGIGVIPNTELAETAQLETENGIVVNSFCQTSDEHVYAVGDVAWHHCPDYDRFLRLESVPNATEQAKIAAAHILGNSKPYHSLPWFWSDQFDMKLQIAGLTAGYDNIIIRGDPDGTRSFAVYYFSGERLLGVDAVNSPRDFVFVRMALVKGQSVDKAVLADPDRDLKEAIV